MKTWMKVVAVLVGVGLLLAYFIISEQRRNARLTAQAAGTITKVTFEKDDESSRIDQTVLEYEFAIAGKRLTGSDSLPGDKIADFHEGQPVTLCYDPADPSDTDVMTGADAKCGS